MAWHPIFVHFPIALIVVVCAFDWGRWLFDRRRLMTGGFWHGTTPLLIIALLGGLAAMTTGLMAEDSLRIPPEVQELVETHETLAFINLGLLAILTSWRIALRGVFPRRGVWIYLLLLVVAVLGIAYGAYYGGLMVYDHGLGVSVTPR